MSTHKSRSDVHKSDSCKLVLRDDVMGMIHNITHFVKVLGGVKKAMEQCTAVLCKNHQRFGQYLAELHGNVCDSHGFAFEPLFRLPHRPCTGMLPDYIR